MTTLWPSKLNHRNRPVALDQFHHAEHLAAEAQAELLKRVIPRPVPMRMRHDGGNVLLAADESGERWLAGHIGPRKGKAVLSLRSTRKARE